jgi:hypothetical protein
MSKKPAIPNSDTFVVNLIGDTTGENQTGKFVAKKRLSFNDQLRRDNYRRQFLGAAVGEPTPRAASMANIFSELIVRLIEAPSWWVDADEGRDLEDENVIIDVFEKAMKIEAEAKAEVAKKAAGAGEELAEAVTEAK